jgi:hypothetical protein
LKRYSKKLIHCEKNTYSETGKITVLKSVAKIKLMKIESFSVCVTVNL